MALYRSALLFVVLGVVPLLAVGMGQCPTPGLGGCLEECTGHDECDDGKLCCFNGCGHQCLAPVDPCEHVDCALSNCSSPGVAFTPEGSCCEVCGCQASNGDFVSPGDSYMDDCNTCVCLSNGLGACTRIFCGPTPTTPPANGCGVTGQVRLECASACNITCANKDSLLICPQVCIIDGCQCPSGTVIDESTNSCVPESDCPPVDPCATVRCATGYQCEVYQPTGEAYCNASCDLDNGGCAAGQTCSLLDVVCIRSPCPPTVQCSDEPVDPCATVRCATGYQCEVYQPTGEAYCNPSCDLDNGGCAAGQTCSLLDVVCIRSPCPPTVQCTDLPECGVTGQVRSGCASICNITCANKDTPMACPLVCIPNGCECPSGTVIDESTNSCVPESDCPSSPPECGVTGQVRSGCASICNITCANKDTPMACPEVCVIDGCECPSGTVIDESTNSCVPESDCPPGCPVRGQTTRGCASNCHITCANRHTMVCVSDVCIPDGCECPSGMVIDEASNSCVQPSDCPVRGTCPSDDTLAASDIPCAPMDECAGDSDCQYSRICCPNGCGGHTCSDSNEMCSLVQCDWPFCGNGVQPITSPFSCCPGCPSCTTPNGTDLMVGQSTKVDCNTCICAGNNNLACTEIACGPGVKDKLGGGGAEATVAGLLMVALSVLVSSILC